MQILFVRGMSKFGHGLQLFYHKALRIVKAEFPEGFGQRRADAPVQLMQVGPFDAEISQGIGEAARDADVRIGQRAVEIKNYNFDPHL